MLIPTAIDPTMAPPGKHMMTVFVQYAPYELASGEPWDGPAREALAETVIAKIARHSPDFRDLILHKERSEEHTSELKSLMRISYAVFCLKKKITHRKKIHTSTTTHQTQNKHTRKDSDDTKH